MFTALHISCRPLESATVYSGYSLPAHENIPPSSLRIKDVPVVKVIIFSGISVTFYHIPRRLSQKAVTLIVTVARISNLSPSDGVNTRRAGEILANKRWFGECLALWRDAVWLL
jgi:hypothetical protein